MSSKSFEQKTLHDLLKEFKTLNKSFQDNFIDLLAILAEIKTELEKGKPKPK